MKKEMIKFVSENFEVIKNNFYKSELNILEEILETEGDQNVFDIFRLFHLQKTCCLLQYKCQIIFHLVSCYP